jgi:hypothetical protein
MKKLTLIFIAFLGFCTVSFGQDFSFDDLLRLRSSPFPSFETAVHDKGYNIDRLDNENNCVVFRKRNQQISRCQAMDKDMSSHCHASVKYTINSREEYERIKSEVEAKTTYIKTKMKECSSLQYVVNIYSNDQVVVHLYDIACGYNCQPYYKIEIFSIYSGY